MSPEQALIQALNELNQSVGKLADTLADTHVDGSSVETLLEIAEYNHSLRVGMVQIVDRLMPLGDPEHQPAWLDVRKSLVDEAGR